MKEERIIKSIEEAQAKEMFGSDLLEAVHDFEKAKNYLVPVLIKNADFYKDVCITNKDKSCFSHYPNLIFKLVNTYGEGGIASIPVTNEMISNWEIDKYDLNLFALEYIKKNFLDYTCRDLFTVIQELTDDLPFPEDPMQPKVKVVTNASGLYGANILLDPSRLAQVLNARFDKSYVIIPSSIHEILVLEEDFRISEISQMIKEVNESQVSEREQLADNPLVLYFSEKYRKWFIK